MAARAVSVGSGQAVARMACLLAALVTVSGGCAGGRVYQAAKLPDELRAPPVENMEVLDLSRLAEYKVSNDLIDRGDVLDVTLIVNYGDRPPVPTPVRVQEDGAANIPVIGEVALAGLTLEDAERVIRSEGMARGKYVDPHVTVTMRRRDVNKVTVLGAVRNQGIYDLPRGSSYLLGALVAAGNLAEDAGPWVEIRRPVPRNQAPALFGPQQPRVAGGEAELTSYGSPSVQHPQAIRVNLVAAAREGSGGHYLDDGDVVMVTKRQPRVIHVMGLVAEPNRYELPPNEEVRVLDAIAVAGGRTSQLADKVWVVRQDPGAAGPVKIKVSVREALANGAANVPLAAGDVVKVEETPVTFVVDLMRNFLRLGLTATPLF